MEDEKEIHMKTNIHHILWITAMERNEAVYKGDRVLSYTKRQRRPHSSFFFFFFFLSSHTVSVFTEVRSVLVEGIAGTKPLR